MGRTERYDPAWAFDLTNGFGKGGADAATAAKSGVARGPAAAETADLGRTAETTRVTSADKADNAAGAVKPPEQHLIDATAREYQDLNRRADPALEGEPDCLSRNKRGPVLSGILDTTDESGQVHFGLNSPGKQAPNDLHPVLQECLDAQTRFYQEQAQEILAKPGAERTLEENRVLKAGIPGYHSEVYALDSALKAHELRTGVPVTPNDLGNFLLHNVNLAAKPAEGGLPRSSLPPRCFNCDSLTDGISLTSRLKDSERLFHESHPH